jgi:hypothetical protein
MICLSCSCLLTKEELRAENHKAAVENRKAAENQMIA